MIGRRVRRTSGDAGSVSILFAVGLLAVLMVIALGVDFGGRLRTVVRAQALAEQAARAGAEQINMSAITGAAVQINQAAATTAAESFLTGTEAKFISATFPDSQSITVSVEIDYDPAMLNLFVPGRFDASKFNITERATARIVAGPP
jgi:Flp pilus assembly protein TadG